jgi:two-component system phosphate regulon sensor histidine kinase PhoR
MRFGRTSLRFILGGIFIAVLVPTLLLIHQAFSQLEADALRRQSIVFNALSRSIDRSLSSLVELEDSRSVDDYRFMLPAVGGAAPRRSALSVLPAASRLPGLITYFEVSAEGVLTTPLLPGDGSEVRRFGITAADESQRRELQATVASILGRNNLSPRAAGARSSIAGSRNSAPRGPSRELDDVSTLETRPQAVEAETKRASPTGDSEEGIVRQAVFDELAASGDAAAPGELDGTPGATRAERAVPEQSESFSRLDESPARVDTFAGDVERLRFARLNSGELVMFRNVWPAGERIVQGAVLYPRAFVEAAFGSLFLESDLAESGELDVRYAGQSVIRFGSAEPPANGPPSDWVMQQRLSPPLAEFELVYSPYRLPPSPAMPLLTWLSVVLAGVLAAGFIAIYRMLVRQIELNEQQRNFVSAVSHELKTPLTSIRMYSEMLSAGWSDADKSKTYYRYIRDESERLSRLIDNVLRLARIDRRDAESRVEQVEVGELLDLARSRVASQAEAAGFELRIGVEEDVRDLHVRVDKDALIQILINLVDNAIKYSKGHERRLVTIRARREAADRLALCVRDFGPGVPRGQLKKLFKLFYRPSMSSTRAVPGTGIGLAVVQQLARDMGGEVDVRNRDPGAEFRLTLPLLKPP